MARLCFTKTGNSIWISHLDLMRLLQRAFRRAGIQLKHSQGYSPHPCLSIAMPLSVGVASLYELADFTLDEQDSTVLADIPQKLNAVLPQGVEILRCYPQGQKLKELKYLEAELTLEYDRGVPPQGAKEIDRLFARQELMVEKQGKKGPTTVDLLPMLHSYQLDKPDDQTLILRAVVSAQNPTLNPQLLATAIAAYLPELAPDFSFCKRLCVYDEQMQIFV